MRSVHEEGCGMEEAEAKEAEAEEGSDTEKDLTADVDSMISLPDFLEALSRVSDRSLDIGACVHGTENGLLFASAGYRARKQILDPVMAELIRPRQLTSARRSTRPTFYRNAKRVTKSATGRVRSAAVIWFSFRGWQFGALRRIHTTMACWH